MKRLLCIIGKMDAGGAETFLMKIYRNLDKNKYQMDFCVNTKEPGFYDEEIKKLGGKIFYSIPRKESFLKSFFTKYTIIKDNKYDYVLRSSQNSISSIDLLAAKIAGAKIRAFRSTNTQTAKGKSQKITHFLFKPLLSLITNVKIAPSKDAAKFLFGNNKKSIIIKNGIPLYDFVYSEKDNIIIRKDLKIDKDTFVIGHIGRLSLQKNHKKLLEIFKDMLKIYPKSVLILVGKGELEKSLKEYSKKLGISNKVMFLGIRNDINHFLSIIDMFIFPSLYEGMPNVVIEAQANGIPCVISNNITNEVVMCDNIVKIDINEKNNVWVDKVKELKSKRYIDNKNINILKNNGYDIQDVTNEFVKVIFKDIL